MIILIKYLPILLGDLVPCNLEVWKWFLLLRKICDILLSKSVPIDIVYELKNLISNYLTLRLQLFPHDNLKPKHHYMVHYPKLILLLGPLVRVWCMRFEAKHRVLLAYGRNCQNKINIPQSLAIKHQLSMTYFFLNKTKDVTVICSAKKICELQKLRNYTCFVSNLPRDFLIDNSKIYYLKWFREKGLKYAVGQFVVIEALQIFQTLLEIIHIIVHPDTDEKLVIGKIWNIIGFNDHIHSHWITDTENWIIKRISDLPEYAPVHKIISNEDGEPYVVLYT